MGSHKLVRSRYVFSSYLSLWLTHVGELPCVEDTRTC